MNKKATIVISIVCLSASLVLIAIAYDRLTYFYGFVDGSGFDKVSAMLNEAPDSDTETITLTWDLVAGAISYNLYWANQEGVTRENGNRIQHVRPSYEFDRIQKGKRYYFVVTAVKGSVESSESNEVSYPDHE